MAAVLCGFRFLARRRPAARLARDDAGDSGLHRSRRTCLAWPGSLAVRRRDAYDMAAGLPGFALIDGHAVLRHIHAARFAVALQRPRPSTIAGPRRVDALATPSS